MKTVASYFNGPETFHAERHFNFLSDRRIRHPVKFTKAANFFCRKSLLQIVGSVSVILFKQNSMKFPKINNPLSAKLMNR